MKSTKILINGFYINLKHIYSISPIYDESYYNGRDFKIDFNFNICFFNRKKININFEKFIIPDRLDFNPSIREIDIYRTKDFFQIEKEKFEQKYNDFIKLWLENQHHIKQYNFQDE